MRRFFTIRKLQDACGRDLNLGDTVRSVFEADAGISKRTVKVLVNRGRRHRMNRKRCDKRGHEGRPTKRIRIRENNVREESPELGLPIVRSIPDSDQKITHYPNASSPEHTMPPLAVESASFGHPRVVSNQQSSHVSTEEIQIEETEHDMDHMMNDHHVQNDSEQAYTPESSIGLTPTVAESFQPEAITLRRNIYDVPSSPEYVGALAKRTTPRKTYSRKIRSLKIFQQPVNLQHGENRRASPKRDDIVERIPPWSGRKTSPKVVVPIKALPIAANLASPSLPLHLHSRPTSASASGSASRLISHPKSGVASVVEPAQLSPAEKWQPAVAVVNPDKKIPSHCSPCSRSGSVNAIELESRSPSHLGLGFGSAAESTRSSPSVGPQPARFLSHSPVPSNSSSEIRSVSSSPLPEEGAGENDIGIKEADADGDNACSDSSSSDEGDAKSGNIEMVDQMEDTDARVPSLLASQSLPHKPRRHMASPPADSPVARLSTSQIIPRITQVLLQPPRIQIASTNPITATSSSQIQTLATSPHRPIYHQFPTITEQIEALRSTPTINKSETTQLMPRTIQFSGNFDARTTDWKKLLKMKQHDMKGRVTNQSDTYSSDESSTDDSSSEDNEDTSTA